MTILTKLLHNTTVLVAALSQQQTNGGCELGTLHAPKPPPFLTNNPIVDGFPWGKFKTASTSDPYTDAPDTGVVRSYDFTFARGIAAPDGYEKSTLLINGQYPGPTIEANWGDTIQVTVHNQITGPEEGTTVHWHGFRQLDTEWLDGVPAISTCPIAPGASYTYVLRASPYGTTWYHSHYSSQYTGGLWGPLIIHGPSDAPYDVDLGPVTLTDYYHRLYSNILTDVMGTDLTKVRPAADTNLINGKMNFDCSNSTTGAKCTNNAGVSKFQFTSGKKHKLRLINTGTAGIQKFSIDNHKLSVISNDMIQIKPYTTEIVTLAVAQRVDVIVEATGKPGDVFWMRSNLAAGQCTEPALFPLGLAAIYYEKANLTAMPGNYSTPWNDTTDPCSNDPLTDTVPIQQIAPGEPDITYHMDVNFAINSTGHLIWTINNSTFRGDLNNPILLLAKSGNTSYPSHPEWNVYNSGNASSVRVVIKNYTPTSHPWHFHAHEMTVIAAGNGTWDGTIANPTNPMRRDVHLLPANGYLVVQWKADNPGVWPFHCHIGWHLSGGLYANMLENPAGIAQLPIPSTSYQLCRDWATFTGSHVVDQIDSGV